MFLLSACALNLTPHAHAHTHRVSLVPDACSAIQVIRTFLGGSKISPRGTELLMDLKAACSSLNLFDLNYALYRCDRYLGATI